MGWRPGSREPRRLDLTGVPADLDLPALAVCNQTAHRFEGQLAYLTIPSFTDPTEPPTAGWRCVGRCSQCGLGILTDH